MDLIILSGKSGVGKTVALSVLEDQGFYCIDNLPISSINKVLSEIENITAKVVISIDIRNINQVHDKKIVTEEIAKLRQKFNVKILLFDCDLKVIVNRYADTRREHPLMRIKKMTLDQAIEYEEQNIHFMRDMADHIIDTSNTNVHQLGHSITSWLKLAYAKTTETENLKLIFNSFGFKNGSPPYSNFIFDVRHLPNPYWDKKLAVHTGLDKPIEEFFLTHNETLEEIEEIKKYLIGWLQRAKNSTIKKFVTISIGCTGGRHRSVYVASQLSKYFASIGYNTQEHHISLDLFKTHLNDGTEF